MSVRYLSEVRMKKCSKCDNEKPLSAFYKRKQMKDGYQSSCKECSNASTKGSRAKKPQQYREVARNLTRQYAADFQKWKEQQKCLVCEEDNSCCLDLHHLDPSQKDMAVSTAVTRWSWNKLQTEIDKCVVVCRNCHAKIHNGDITLGLLV